ncbi:hypothetical protein C8J57DRAFT_1094141 [Mycena rebaudengoi]|nr:hypothetical protein C8J57DRAFT_1094141 [Mycena rebaudengoi]
MFTLKLYAYLWDTLHPIYEQDQTLEHNFSNSIFPTATANCGPHTSTFEHTDFLNLMNGLCSTSCGGSFDPTTSALFYMCQFNLVIEFLPGTSLLIPSTICSHGNMPLKPGEMQVLFTQYAAGAAYGYQSVKHYYPSLGTGNRKEQHDGAPRS